VKVTGKSAAGVGQFFIGFAIIAAVLISTGSKIKPALTLWLGDGSRLYSSKTANTAIIPVPRLEMDSYDWYQRHRDVLAAQKQSEPHVVLIGDSITHFWDDLPAASGPHAWERAFGGLSVLNLGFGWDRTQNVLWRLSHGEFEGLHPTTVVINIGTNNLTGTENARTNTPDEIVQGILAIHKKIRVTSPASHIIVMGIFPRGSDPASPVRAAIIAVNRLLSEALANEPNTTFLDIGDRFLAPDGTLLPNMMSDGTHPTEEGYAIWAQALIEAGVRN
jgi:lysophospholipase L1-like esterase